MKLTKISDVCEVIAGQSPPSSTYNQDQNGLPFFQGNADFGNLHPSVRYWCNAPIKIAKVNDILISVRAPVGAVNINNTEACIGRGLAAIRTGEKIDRKYLFHFLIGNRNRIEDLGTGSTFKAITMKTLRDLEIPLPPLKTQQKIAAILDEADRLRQLNKQLIQKYEDLSQSLFLEMFGDTWNNPKNWDEYLVEEIASKKKNSIKAGPFGSALKKEFYTENGYKIYGQEQVIRDDFEYGDYYIDKDRFEKLKNCEIKSGDILISLVGTYGKISVVPEKFEKGIINPRLMKITPDEEIIRPIFLKILLQSIGVEIQLKNFSRGGTMDIVNVGIIRKVKVPVPPIKMQDNFLKKRDLIQKQIESIENNCSLSEELFNSLLQKAFKGEVV